MERYGAVLAASFGVVQKLCYQLAEEENVAIKVGSQDIEKHLIDIKNKLGLM